MAGYRFFLNYVWSFSEAPERLAIADSRKNMGQILFMSGVAWSSICMRFQYRRV
jgi:hypothetical protein